MQPTMSGVRTLSQTARNSLRSSIKPSHWTRYTHTQSHTRTHYTRHSHRTFSTVIGLSLGMIASGTALLLTVEAEGKSPASQETHTQTKSNARVHKKSDTARNVTDLGAIDFRTLGITPCPTLPKDAPQWLRDQAKDQEFQFRDLGAILDTTDHLMYDGLSGERKLTEVYYFCEKVDTSKPEVPGASHDHPHLPPSLDFQPQTPASAKHKTHASTSWTSSVTSYIASWWPFGARPAAAEAIMSPKHHTKAFDQFNPEVIHMKATGPEVRAIFHVGRALCGHKGIIHGGMTAALMDEVSGAATFCAAGGGNFTANLNINYLKPVRAGQYLLVRAQAVKQDGRKTYVNISVEDGVGGVFARGTALYVKPKMLPPSVMVAATQ